MKKKDASFVWDQACHNAFESIKKYLTNLPILGAPMVNKPLMLYIAAQKCSRGALLVITTQKVLFGSLY